MTWFAVVDGSGNLVSTGTVPADGATLAANGYSAIALDGDPTGKVWDKPTQAFVAGPPKPISVATWKFIQRFTPAEYVAIEASQDPQVRQFLTMLMAASNVILTETVVQGGLQYLVFLGLLTSGRASAIGAA
jgi:hypothetical protein